MLSEYLFRICRILFVLLLMFFVVPDVRAGNGMIELAVTERDTLIGICGKHLENPLQWPTIARINKLKNPNLILPGERLLIPAHMLKGVPSEGIITFLKGDVRILSHGDVTWNSARLNQTIAENKRIKTGPDGVVEITLKNGTSILQKQDTELAIVSIREKGGIYDLSRLFLKVGRIITNIRRATGKENRFEIDTPSAVAVARGTGFRSAADDKATSRFEVLDGRIGVEALKQTIDVGGGEGTLVRKGEAPQPARKLPEAPILLDRKPIYKNLPLKLQFQGSGEVASIRAILARDKDLKDIVKEEVMARSVPFEIAAIADGIYFLQSTAIDADGVEGLPQQTTAITVRTNPLPPFIQTPSDKGEYGGKKVDLSWLKVRDASSYRIQISEDRDFTRVVVDDKGLTTMLRQIKLPDFKTYYFRICSVAGDGYEGGWSDMVSFTLSPLPPAPSLDAPQIGKEQLSIKWQDLGKEVSVYHFQMARDEAFQQVIVDKTIEKPQIVMEKPRTAGTYYVRIGSVNKKGFHGDFSPPQTLEIFERPPFLIMGIVVALLFVLF